MDDNQNSLLRGSSNRYESIFVEVSIVWESRGVRVEHDGGRFGEADGVLLEIP
jgi:hypothetical protein